MDDQVVNENWLSLSSVVTFVIVAIGFYAVVALGLYHYQL